MSNKAVIILSGGMDSVTTLALAKDRGYDCYTLSFNYGQKSISELDAALYYSKKYHCIKHKVFDPFAILLPCQNSCNKGRRMNYFKQLLPF